MLKQDRKKPATGSKTAKENSFGRQESVKHKKHLTDCKMACLCKKRRAGKVRALGRAQQWQPQAHRLPQLLVRAAQVTEHSLQVTAAHPQQLGDEEAQGGKRDGGKAPSVCWETGY